MRTSRTRPVLCNQPTALSALRNISARADGAYRNGTRTLPMLAQIRVIRELDSILERRARMPAQSGKAADIEPFARRAVGPRGVKAELAGISDNGRHHPREFG